MCKSKQEGGHRCASHSPANRRLGRAAVRLFGHDTPVARVAVERMDPKFVHGTIAERAHIAATTYDFVTRERASVDPSAAVRDALDKNPVQVTRVSVLPTEAEVDAWEKKKKAAAKKTAAEDSEAGTPPNASITAAERKKTAAQDDALRTKGIEARAEIEEMRVRESAERERRNEALRANEARDQAVRVADAAENERIYKEGPEWVREFADARKERDAQVRADVPVEQANSKMYKKMFPTITTGEMPRRDPEFYSGLNSMGEQDIKKRGWTDAHVKRLLGDPDFVGFGWRYFGHERVMQAEAQDTKLQKRLASEAKKNRWPLTPLMPLPYTSNHDREFFHADAHGTRTDPQVKTDVSQ